jgi:environmental stress-induced protein Ves
MKRTILFSLCVVLLASMSAMAATGSGTLTLTATVTDSINLVLNSDASGLALSSGSGTNAATLAFGNIQAFGGAVPAGVTRTTTASDFTVSTPVDVYVAKYNNASPNFTLTAQLGSADAVNTWHVGGVAVTSGAAAQITTTGAYASADAQPIALTVPFTSASGTLISNTINFVATAN